MKWRDRGGRGERARNGKRMRLRYTLGLLVLAVVVGGVYGAGQLYERGVREIALPLRHDDIIRQQARDKGLDPYLIAAVIYEESRFRPRPSSAGAQGLMQILPSTGRYIASKSGGSNFVEADLADPQINISYGSWYLRYLLRRYKGHEALALAAYNAGEGKVDEWVGHVRVHGREFAIARDIPFPETRHYVLNVLKSRDRYRSTYRKELAV